MCRRACLIVLAAVISSGFALADDRPIPVVVELFTSEGCSSCPPADNLLSKLEKTQPVPHIRIIGLSEHVDYWNQLGWKDPFSSALFRIRQNNYAHGFHTDQVFTPQMIVDGVSAFVGGDYDRTIAEISRQAIAPSYAVSVHANADPQNTDAVNLSVNLRTESQPSDADVLLAITEDNISSNVNAGENSGHTLRHTSVVRSFGVVKKLNKHSDRSMDFDSALKFPSDWKRQDLRAVVFVQDRSSHRIIGASTLQLAR